jgi:hypothetical protein
MPDKHDPLISGALRRSAFTRLTKEQRMKYEIAGELGLLPRIRQVGWAGLSAKETGRIGGLLSRRKNAAKKGD